VGTGLSVIASGPRAARQSSGRTKGHNTWQRPLDCHGAKMRLAVTAGAGVTRECNEAIQW